MLTFCTRSHFAGYLPATRRAFFGKCMNRNRVILNSLASESIIYSNNVWFMWIFRY